MKKNPVYQLKLAPSLVLPTEMREVKVRALRQGMFDTNNREPLLTNLIAYMPILVRERATKANSYEVLNIGDSRVEAFINSLADDTTVAVHVLTKSYSNEELRGIRYLTAEFLPHVGPIQPLRQALRRLVASPELTDFINKSFDINPRNQAKFSSSGVIKALGSSAPALNTIKKIFKQHSLTTSSRDASPKACSREEIWDEIALRNDYPVFDVVLARLERHKINPRKLFERLDNHDDSHEEFEKYASRFVDYIESLSED
jgi:hypothetical protein